MRKKKYNCLKCPGYCCSYPVIEVKDRDAKRDLQEVEGRGNHFDGQLGQLVLRDHAVLVSDRAPVA